MAKTNNDNDNDSLLTNIAQAYMVLKGVKGLAKVVVGPLALSALGYYAYRKFKDRMLTA
jgi:hypothetical protein